jgi:hypothetical protein
VKKVPFFLGLNAPFKERKKYFLNKRPLFLERKCPFRSSKDSVKAISDVIETPNFRSAREHHKIVRFWSYTKVPLLVNAPSLSKCFRDLCTSLLRKGTN